MPRDTSTRSTAPSKLRSLLKRLDAARTKIASLTKDADQLAKEALAAFKRDAIGTEIFIAPNRKAIVVTPDEITTDAEKFREVSLINGQTLEQINRCFTLLRERAVALIGESQLAECETRKPGKVSQIRFTGKR